MGIKFQDLKAGSFYKGYHQPAPQGVKCFYFVLQVGTNPGLGSHMPVELMYVLRNTTSKSWSRQFVKQGFPDEESLLKQEVHLSALTADGISPPRVIGLPAGALPTPTPVPVPPTPPPMAKPLPPRASSNAPTISPQELAAEARARRNAGKVAIPENARSPRCVKCGGMNKSVAMFSFSAFTCTTCEPE